ncbi:MAG: response regulator, partial [Planctomycetales bacterium]|nr:response regulator [Planctomycetales bacterium]
ATSANHAKTQFLTTVSHEIRTPMNGVLGITELLLRTPLTPAQETHLKVVRESGQSLLALMNDLLDISKIEAGKLNVENIEFNLRETLENVAKLLAAPASEKGLELICEIDNEAPAYVKGDPTRLRQVLVNLVSNAVKFTIRGEIHMLAEKSLSGVRFSVRDTGIGIPKEKQRLVFDAFEQTDPSTSRKFGGTGLGLSICSTLVNLMGGQIRLDSEPGLGSTFTFYLPFAQTVYRNDTSKSKFARLRALLCCGRATAHRAYVRLLESFDIAVSVADDLAGVLQADASDYDLIVVDAPSVEDDQRIADWGVPAIGLVNAYDVEREHMTLVVKPVTRNELSRAIAAQQTEKAESDANTIERPIIWHSPLTVLVADDSPVNQEVAVGLLEFYGYKSRVANNGQEVVDLATKHDFDVILMDLQMPVLDGFEATRALRELGNGVPIIAMTANALLDTNENCIAAGMDGYISKPFAPDVLFQTIHEACAAKSASAQISCTPHVATQPSSCSGSC